MHAPRITRRQVLLAGLSGIALSGPAGVHAQPGRPSGKPVLLAQVLDMSPGQQDVSRDFLAGARAAWQDINARGGLKGRPVQHLVMEVDGSPGSVRAAVSSIRDNAACMALFATTGDMAATQVAQALRQEALGIAHVAPWLQNSSTEVDDRTFPVFAGRQEQIAHALKSLSVMNVGEIGAVYASEAEFAAYQDDVSRTAAALGVRTRLFRTGGDLQRAAQRLGADSPAILLFIGGTPELVQFTQGLDRQTRQRYVVALADVNLQTLNQMGAGKSTPVIATQPVPLVTAGLPIVRSFREVFSRLFDEAPTALGLAGFIAARYTHEVLSDVDAPLTRASVLAAFQRRASMDLGGYRIHYDAVRRRSAGYVTQSMLGADGRVIG